MPDKSKIKELKRVKQLTGSYCGPAVFEMLVSNLGFDLNQDSLVDASNARETVAAEGISLPDLAHGLGRLYPDLKVWKKENAKVEDIKILVEFGYFVAVDWQGIFNSDEYGDEIWNSGNKLSNWWRKVKNDPEALGEQGHYCIALEVNTKKGYLRFADPYGHYAGKDRFIAIWEFEERWWDDRIGLDEKGKKVRIVENNLLFVVTQKEDKRPEELGLMEI